MGSQASPWVLAILPPEVVSLHSPAEALLAWRLSRPPGASTPLFRHSPIEAASRPSWLFNPPWPLLRPPKPSPGASQLDPAAFPLQRRPQALFQTPLFPAFFIFLRLSATRLARPCHKAGIAAPFSGRLAASAGLLVEFASRETAIESPKPSHFLGAYLGQPIYVHMRSGGRILA